MEVSALCVDMTDCDLRTESNVGKCIGHSAAFKSVLEFGTHEPITVTRVLEDEEVDLEHEHVKDDRDGD